MLVYYFVPFIVSNRYLLFWVSSGHNSVTVQNRTYVYMNFFDHKDLGNHLTQLCPKLVKHPACPTIQTDSFIWVNTNKQNYRLQHATIGHAHTRLQDGIWAAGTRILDPVATCHHFGYTVVPKGDHCDGTCLIGHNGFSPDYLRLVSHLVAL